MIQVKRWLGWIKCFNVHAPPHPFTMAQELPTTVQRPSETWKPVNPVSMCVDNDNGFNEEELLLINQTSKEE